MKKNTVIPRNEWLAALDAIGCGQVLNDPTALTTKELRVLWSVGTTAVRRRLGKLIIAGLAERTQKQTVRGATAAYRLIKGTK